MNEKKQSPRYIFTDKPQNDDFMSGVAGATLRPLPKVSGELVPDRITGSGELLRYRIPGAENKYADGAAESLAAKTNLYKNTGGNPINRSDPQGQFEWVNPIKYWRDFFGGAGDLYRNYKNMRDANTIGDDKYFHCKGHCQASRRGDGGRDASAVIGEGRELIDEYINNPRKGMSKKENIKDCNKDRAANSTGRDGDQNKTCKQICSPLRPKGLDKKY